MCFLFEEVPSRVRFTYFFASSGCFMCIVGGFRRASGFCLGFGASGFNFRASGSVGMKVLRVLRDGM